jgi:hypothetical protein
MQLSRFQLIKINPLAVEAPKLPLHAMQVSITRHIRTARNYIMVHQIYYLTWINNSVREHSGK